MLWDLLYLQLDQPSRRRRYCTGNLALVGSSLNSWRVISLRARDGERERAPPAQHRKQEAMNIKEVKKGDKILHSHLGTQPPVSGVVMESPKQGRGVRSTILVDVKGSEVGLFDEVGSIYTSEILKVFRNDNWLPVEQ